jgi:hypothetical protein
VEDNISQCKNILIGKILSDKPISIQVLYNTLSGIWCNPPGFKINKLEGKLYQIKFDKEEDLLRSLKGSPWVISIHNLDFTTIPLWVQFWGLPLHRKYLIMGREMGSKLGQVLDV